MQEYVVPKSIPKTRLLSTVTAILTSPLPVLAVELDAADLFAVDHPLPGSAESVSYAAALVTP